MITNLKHCCRACFYVIGMVMPACNLFLILNILFVINQFLLDFFLSSCYCICLYTTTKCKTIYGLHK